MDLTEPPVGLILVQGVGERRALGSRWPCKRYILSCSVCGAWLGYLGRSRASLLIRPRQFCLTKHRSE